MILPEPICQYIGNWIMGQRTLGYILLGPDGEVRMWGGALERLGIKMLQEGKPIADQLLFMEGMLPMEETSIHLAMVKPDVRHSLDLHLFQIDDGYGLIVMDATETERQLAIWQQKANELALGGRQTAVEQLQALSTETKTALANFLQVLNIAALEREPNGEFSLIGKAPLWLTQLCPEAAAQPCFLSPGNVFSFLDNFLHDAEHLWKQNTIDYLKSGLWIETDEESNEHLLEATAIDTGQHKMLLISRDTCLIDEKQELIQKGRDLAIRQGAGHRLQAELEARIHRRTEALEKANARLAAELEQRKALEQERSRLALHLQQAQKMEAIGTLAGGIAHDFNNILSAVIGFSELSLSEIPKNSKLHTNVQHVLAAGHRAKALIRQILTFSRHSEPEVKPVQLETLAKEALKLLRASLPATIEIRQEIKSHGYVMADPTQIHQVIMNLCTNASQAMSTTGGVLELRIKESTISQRGVADAPDLQPGPYLELVVKDSGEGMTREVLARIFEPFFTTKAKGEGTGMGLSVVHGIVQSCRGTIQVTSKPGKGAIFRVLLPAMPPVTSEQSASVTDLPTGEERILFVDDEAALINLAVRSLSMLGYDVKAETDGAKALDMFATAPSAFDLVITDMNMPKMTGEQLAKAMLKIRKDVPIILCSGYIEAVTEESIKKLGIKGYLMKPIAMTDLAKTIRVVLDAKA